jgi:hypothetical protein
MWTEKKERMYKLVVNGGIILISEQAFTVFLPYQKSNRVVIFFQKNVKDVGFKIVVVKKAVFTLKNV